MPCEAYKSAEKLTHVSGEPNVAAPPHPHPAAVALSKQPQFIAIRYAQNSNLHNSAPISSNYCVTQPWPMLPNTPSPHTPPHPPSLVMTKPLLALLPVTYRLLHLTAAFPPGLGKLIEWGTADKTPHVEPGRMLGRLFHTSSRRDGCGSPSFSVSSSSSSSSVL